MSDMFQARTRFQQVYSLHIPTRYSVFYSHVGRWIFQTGCCKSDKVETLPSRVCGENNGIFLTLGRLQLRSRRPKHSAVL